MLKPIKSRVSWPSLRSERGRTLGSVFFEHYLIYCCAARNGTDTEARNGEFVLGNEAYPAKRQDLPTVVECFKSYDSVNLVKTADVGQVESFKQAQRYSRSGFSGEP